MKYLIHISVFSILCFASTAFAQDQTPPTTNNTTSLAADASSVFHEGGNGNLVGGGLGMSFFGNQTYYTMSLYPELAFGQIGVGLNINLRVGTDGSVRAADWNDGIRSVLRLIRYVRYGEKFSPTYIRVGELDGATLGHGTIMGSYRNNASYDDRQIGLEFDMNFGSYGFESVTSSFGRFDVFGVRPYVRPLLQTGIPIIKGVEIGATYAGDFGKNANVFSPTGSTDSSSFSAANASSKGNIAFIGFDIGFPILRLPILDVDVYGDYDHALGYGNGEAFGVKGSLKGLDALLKVGARLEHRIYGSQFTFDYFDGLYQISRYQQVGTDVSGNPIIQTKANQMLSTTDAQSGVYGDLGAVILSKLRVYGSYQRLYRTPLNGLLHLATGLNDIVPSIVVKADYYKRNIGNETGIFTVDAGSLATVEAGYKPYPYLLVSLVYEWTFTPITDGNTVVGYQPQRHIEPRVSLNFNF
jgi:hypothetical protein